MTLQILCTLFCGLIIGLERELKNKNAGVKTSIYVCMSAFLFTKIGIEIQDIGRVVAQVISGSSFIGSGIIILNKDKGSGLTSAAIMWTLTAIGLLCGINKEKEAIILSILIVLIDVIMTKVNQKIIKFKDKNAKIQK